MALSELSLIKLNSYFVCLCILYYSSQAAITSYDRNSNRDDRYYRYSIDGLSSKSKRDVEHIITRLADNYASDTISGLYPSNHDKGLRSKRYVENVISRLADNYAPDTNGGGYPSSHDKDLLMGGWARQGRMEIVGNVAVPSLMPSHHADPLPTDSSHNSHSPGVLFEGGDAFSAHPTDHQPVPTISHDGDNKSPKPSKKTDDKKPISEPKKFEGPKSTDQAKLEKILNAHDLTPSNHNEKSTVSPRKSMNTQIDDEDFDMNSGEFPQEVTNNTLEKNNITGRQEDHHIYYNSTFITDAKVVKDFWVDLEKEKGVIINEMLSASHRRAATVELSFDFPFYGHSVRNMTIATGGFLYTGDYIHSWLAATQYIAPLMANFDTSISDDSFVKYRDNGTALTVEWQKVWLQDRVEAGDFSFQVTLHKTGDIVFVYKSVPILVDQIEDTQHPVKVGLSDAYIIDKTIFFVRRKTIYEYHRVNFKRDDIRNWTVIYLNALPTCMVLTDCKSCSTARINFECSWCESVGRCSSGFDRRRQEWTSKQCELTSVTDDGECNAPSRSLNLPSHRHLPHVANIHSDEANSESGGGVQLSGMLGLFLIVALIGGLGMWLLYAYRNPHTPSGQILIKYRPSQWSLRRGEARYTAASIHM